MEQQQQKKKKTLQKHLGHSDGILKHDKNVTTSETIK